MNYIFAVESYLGMAKLKKIQKLQSKIEKENRINVLTMASIPVVIIALIISGFWFAEYFKITYSIDKSAVNSIYTTISEEVVYTNDYEGYYSILTTDSILKNKLQCMVLERLYIIIRRMK